MLGRVGLGLLFKELRGISVPYTVFCCLAGLLHAATAVAAFPELSPLSPLWCGMCKGEEEL